jgi:hypothetical protein
MNSAGAEAGLGDRETVAFATDQVGTRDANVSKG